MTKGGTVFADGNVLPEPDVFCSVWLEFHIYLEEFLSMQGAVSELWKCNPGTASQKVFPFKVWALQPGIHSWCLALGVLQSKKCRCHTSYCCACRGQKLNVNEGEKTQIMVKQTPLESPHALSSSCSMGNVTCLHSPLAWLSRPNAEPAALPQDRVSGYAIRASASHPQTYALINEFPAVKETLHLLSSACLWSCLILSRWVGFSKASCCSHVYTTAELFGFQDTAVMKSRSVLSHQGSAMPSPDKQTPSCLFSSCKCRWCKCSTQVKRLPLFLHVLVLIQWACVMHTLHIGLCYT